MIDRLTSDHTFVNFFFILFINEVVYRLHVNHVYILIYKKTVIFIFLLENDLSCIAVFRVNKFSFDEQVFEFQIYTEFPITRTVFEPNRLMKNYEDTLFNIEGEDGINIPNWTVTKVKTSLDRYVEGDYTYEGFILKITAERQSFYYIIKILLPILFILIISWSVFWIHPKEVDAKVNVTIVSLLALIAYNFIIDEEIPKLDYLTFLDAFIFTSYLFTGGSTILCVYAHNRFIRYANSVNKVQYYAKYFGPLIYVIIMIIIYAFFFLN